MHACNPAESETSNTKPSFGDDEQGAIERAKINKAKILELPSLLFKDQKKRCAWGYTSPLFSVLMTSSTVSQIFLIDTSSIKLTSSIREKVR